MTERKYLLTAPYSTPIGAITSIAVCRECGPIVSPYWDGRKVKWMHERGTSHKVDIVKHEQNAADDRQCASLLLGDQDAREAARLNREGNR